MKSSLVATVRSFAAATLAVLLAGPALADPPRFSIKDITPPGLGPPAAGARVINNAGQVAGFFGDDLAFLYDDRDGSWITFSQDDFLATDINEAGTVIGVDRSASVRIFEEGVLTLIAVFDGVLRDAVSGGLNDAGTAVGWVEVEPFDEPPSRAFLYSDGMPRLLDLGIDQGPCSRSEAHDINNAGQIVGGIEMPAGSDCRMRAFLHENGETLLIGDLLPDQATRAIRINESGQALVWVASNDPAFRLAVGSYLYSEGELEQIGDDQTSAHGLNDTGWIVGEIGRRPESDAFLYADGELYELADLVPDLTGWDRLSVARDVNDAGQIVGFGQRADGLQAAFMLTPFDVNVKLDVRPQHAGNRINLGSKDSLVAVAVLSGGIFDATQVNWETVKFGPKKAREHHQQIHVKDVDRDGDMDAVLHFNIRQAGIRCRDTRVTLTGKTFSGVPFRGTDRIEPVNCRKKQEH